MYFLQITTLIFSLLGLLLINLKTNKNSFLMSTHKTKQKNFFSKICLLKITLVIKRKQSIESKQQLQQMDILVMKK